MADFSHHFLSLHHEKFIRYCCNLKKFNCDVFWYLRRCALQKALLFTRQFNWKINIVLPLLHQDSTLLFCLYNCSTFVLHRFWWQDWNNFNKQKVSTIGFRAGFCLIYFVVTQSQCLHFPFLVKLHSKNLTTVYKGLTTWILSRKLSESSWTSNLRSNVNSFFCCCKINEISKWQFLAKSSLTC